MALIQTITVTESTEQLTKLISTCTISTKPLLKMLLAIVNGITSTNGESLPLKELSH